MPYFSFLNKNVVEKLLQVLRTDVIYVIYFFSGKKGFYSVFFFAEVYATFSNIEGNGKI